MKKPSKKRLLEIAEDSCGVVLYAARKANVDRRTFHRWINRYEWLKIAMVEARDLLVDEAEMVLVDAMKEKKDVKAAVYITSTLGRKRGYTQMIETRDRSKLKDAMEDLSNEELIEMLERNGKRINDC